MSSPSSGQKRPSIDALSDGGFIVVWESHGQDGSSRGVYGQRYDAAGLAAGPEFRISERTANAQEFAAVAGLPGGGFAVTWLDNQPLGFTKRYEVRARVYDAEGAPVTNEYFVNDVSAGYQREPDLAVLQNGDFVVAWESQNVDGSGYAVMGQIYRPNGTATGGNFMINTSTAGDQLEVEVEGTPSGGFVATWWTPGTPDVQMMQHFDANGVKVGPEILVGSGDLHGSPDLGILPDNGIVTVRHAADGNDGGVFAREFAIGRMIQGTAGNDLLLGREGVDEFFGLAGDDTIDTAGGDDLLDPGPGDDVLVGGAGSDQYVFGRGYGADLIQNANEAQSKDVVSFGVDVTPAQVWFERTGDDLVASIVGTTDSVTIENWYLGDQYHVDEFQTADGFVLTAAQTETLVSVMATFQTPETNGTELPGNIAAAMEPIIADIWQPASAQGGMS